MLDKTKYHIKSLIADGDIDEAISALENVIDKETSIYNNLVVIVSRYRKNLNEKTLGTIDDKEWRLTYNTFVKNILTIIDTHYNNQDETEKQFIELVKNGKELLIREDYKTASLYFSKALALKQDEEILNLKKQCDKKAGRASTIESFWSFELLGIKIFKLTYRQKIISFLLLIVGGFTTYFLTRTNIELIKVTDSGNFIVKKDNYFGIRDASSKQQTQFVYDSIIDMGNGLIVAYSQDTVSIINENNLTTIEQKGTGKVTQLNKGTIVLNQNEQWELIRKDSTSLNSSYFLEFELDANIIKAKTTNGWGMLSTTGEAIIPFIFDTLSIEGNYIIGTKNGKEYRYNNLGNCLDCDEDIFEIKENDITRRNKTLSFNSITNTNSLTNDYKSELEEISQEKLKKLIPTDIIAFKNKKSNKVGYLYKYYQIVIPFEYEDGKAFSINGLAPVKKKGKWGFINRFNQVVIDYQFDDASKFNQGLAGVKKGNKWGFINKNGKVVIDFKYNDIDEKGFSGYRARVKLNNKERYITMLGQDYDFIHPNYEKLNIVLVQDKGKYGYVDFSGKLVIPLIYNDATSTINGYAKVKKANKWGMINENRKIIIPLLYDEIEWYKDSWIWNPFHNGIMKVKKNGKSIIINKLGDEFDDYKETYYQNILVKKNDKWGCMTVNGKLIVPLEFEELKGVSMYYYLEAKKNGKWGVIDLSNNTIVTNFKYDKLDYDKELFLKYLSNKTIVNSKNCQIVFPFKVLDFEKEKFLISFCI